MQSEMTLPNGTTVWLIGHPGSGLCENLTVDVWTGNSLSATITAYHPDVPAGSGAWYEAEIASGAVIALDPGDESLSWGPLLPGEELVASAIANGDRSSVSV